MLINTIDLNGKRNTITIINKAMHPFEVIMISCITGLAITSGLFIVLRNMPRKSEGVEWIIASTLMMAFSYLMAFIFSDDVGTLRSDVAFYLLNATCLFCFTMGSSYFVSKPVSLRKTLMVSVLMVTTALCIRVLTPFVLMADIVLVLYGSGLLVYSAWLYFNERHDVTPLHKPVASLLLFNAIHFLDYPWLRHIEWFAPIGFLISNLAFVTACILLATIALLQFRSRVMQSEEAAIYAANHDPLTGLHNRLALDGIVDVFITEATEKGQPFVLLYIDLDGFKQVNDRYGHKAGDFVLCAVTDQVLHVLPQPNKMMRIGGDEFVIIFNHIAFDEGGQQQIEDFIDKILKAIDQPIHHNPETYQVSGSIGVSLYPMDADNLNDLLVAADKAMYKAKSKGANGYCFAKTLKNSQVQSNVQFYEASPMSETITKARVPEFAEV